MLRLVTISLTISMLALSLTAAEPTTPPALATNGDFTAGWTGWNPNDKDKAAGTVSLASEDGNTFLRLAKPTQVVAKARIEVNPAWKKLHVSCRMRLSSFAANPDISWGNARLANSFVMPEDKRAYLGIVLLSADTDPAKDGGWVKLATVVDIPAGALQFEIGCGNFGMTGQTDFDDVTITAE